MFRCSAYCIAEKFNVEALSKHLQGSKAITQFYDQVIHVSKDKNKNKNIFYFPFGVVVFWGFDLTSEMEHINIIKSFSINPHKIYGEDFMQYYYDDKIEESAIDEEEDMIILENQDPFIKLAISYALSQTVVLDVFEASTRKLINDTRFISDELSNTGEVKISRTRLAKLIGRMFGERNLINLHSDILDTPEIFWKRPKYEQYYLMASDSLDIDQRHEILNTRLEVIKDLYDQLSDELNHRHSANLEMVIIILITIEVLLALIKDFF